MAKSRRSLGWIWLCFILLLVLAFLLRPRPAQVPPQQTQESALQSDPLGVEKRPGTDEPSPPPSPAGQQSPVELSSQTAPQYRQATLRFQVTDVSGWVVDRPGLSVILRTGAGGGDREADGSFKVRLWGNECSVQVLCGDLNSTHPLQPGENVIPLRHGSEFGEVAVQPADWEKVRIRRVGQAANWRLPSGMDPQIGRRFLFVTPGTYEISDHGEFVAGRVEVVAGGRATFTLSRLAGIKLEVAFTNESDERKPPKMLPIRIRGLSEDASYPRGFRISMVVGNRQRMYVESGLVPGTYEVTSEELNPHFLQVVDVKGGEVRTVRILHTLP